MTRAWLVVLPMLLACGNGGAVTADPGVDPGADVAATDPGVDPAADTAPDQDPGPGPTDAPFDLAALPETIGGERPAAVHVPTDYDPGRAWPLVILLHGYGATGFIQDIYLGLSAHATPAGFVEVVPEGTVDKDGNQFWNAPSCCDLAGKNVDDIGYVRGLIAEAKQVFHIDPERVFLVGHSNGAFLSISMLCNASDVITGIAEIAGSIGPDPAVCTPARPVSALVIHGTADTVIPYDGGSIFGKQFVGVDQTLGRVREVDGCGTATVAAGPFDFDDDVAGAETTSTTWTGCQGGTKVEFWHMQGSSHVPNFSFAFQDALVAWLMGI